MSAAVLPPRAGPQCPRGRAARDRAPAAAERRPQSVASDPSTPWSSSRRAAPALIDESGNEYVDYLLGSGPLLARARASGGRRGGAGAARARHELSVGERAGDPARRGARRARAVRRGGDVSQHGLGGDVLRAPPGARVAPPRRHPQVRGRLSRHGRPRPDEHAMDAGARAVSRGRAPSSRGIPASAPAEVLVAPFNDVATTTAIIERHHDALAAVIVEPLQRTIPPAPGFLAELRRITAHYGIVLVFDEVVTGFRLGPRRRPGTLRGHARPLRARQEHLGRASARRGVRTPRRSSRAPIPSAASTATACC